MAVCEESVTIYLTDSNSMSITILAYQLSVITELIVGGEIVSLVGHVLVRISLKYNFSLIPFAAPLLCSSSSNLFSLLVDLAFLAF